MTRGWHGHITMPKCSHSNESTHTQSTALYNGVVVVFCFSQEVVTGQVTHKNEERNNLFLLMIWAVSAYKVHQSKGNHTNHSIRGGRGTDSFFFQIKSMKKKSYVWDILFPGKFQVYSLHLAWIPPMRITRNHMKALCAHTHKQWRSDYNKNFFCYLL